jgi:uncharacterized protein (TIGR00251 family)
MSEEAEANRHWARPIKGAWVLELLVQPGARRTEVVGPLGASLKIRVAARADGGRANAELIQFLVEALGVTRASIKIVRGGSSRKKLVLVDAAIDPAQLWADA